VSDDERYWQEILADQSRECAKFLSLAAGYRAEKGYERSTEGLLNSHLGYWIGIYARKAGQ
jgi:hypothetical protein